MKNELYFFNLEMKTISEQSKEKSNKEKEFLRTRSLSKKKIKKGNPPLVEDENTQTQKVFKEYCEQLEANEIKDAESKITEAKGNFESKMEVRRIRTTELIWARRTQQEYSMFCNNISALIKQEAVELNNIIGNLKIMDGELRTKLTATIEAIKDTKNKLAVADAAALALVEGIKDSNHSLQVKIIRENLKNGTGNSQKDTLDSSIDELVQFCNTSQDLADDMFEMAVKTSAINAFVNIDSLTEFGTTTEININLFHTDVEKNLGYATSQIASIQEELKVSLRDLNKAKHQTFKTDLQMIVLDGAKAFVTDKTAPVAQDINSICIAVEAVSYTHLTLPTNREV